MRDHLQVFVNGTPHRVTGADAFASVSDFLRRRLGLIGTKIVCSEGDCGACSVLVGRPQQGRLHYQPVDACILFMFQADGSHVVTVEGLNRNGALSPVQEEMVRGHASQCGFCTPGFVVALTALFEQESTRRHLSDAEMRYGLCGNLCRCTGYTPILDSGRRVDAAGLARLEELYPDAEIASALSQGRGDPVALESGGRRLFLPTDLPEAVRFKREHPQAVIVSGATDLGVRWNKGEVDLEVILGLNNIADLAELTEHDGVMVAGARVTWTQVEHQLGQRVPELNQILWRFGSPQIRHVATMAGNIANASPIADALPFLFVMNAELELIGPSGSRRVNINDFYRGYKQMDLGGDELIHRIHTPLPRDGDILKLYKISRRKDLDISTFTAAVWMRIDGETVRDARIAYGGVGPVVLRLPRTEAWLTGHRLSAQRCREAGRLARTEITPITDVRGSKQYRSQLAENILVKFYHDVRP